MWGSLCQHVGCARPGQRGRIECERPETDIFLPAIVLQERTRRGADSQCLWIRLHVDTMARPAERWATTIEVVGFTSDRDRRARPRPALAKRALGLHYSRVCRRESCRLTRTSWTAATRDGTESEPISPRRPLSSPFSDLDPDSDSSPSHTAFALAAAYKQPQTDTGCEPRSVGNLLRPRVGPSAQSYSPETLSRLSIAGYGSLKAGRASPEPSTPTLLRSDEQFVCPDRRVSCCTLTVP